MDVKPGPFASAEDAQTVADAGAGSIGDLIRASKAAGVAFTATAEECAAMGAGFVQDVFKTALATEEPPPDTFDTPVVSISNAIEAVVTVHPDHVVMFPIGSTVKFSGTGNATLDHENADYYVLANDGTTFTVNADLSAEAAPITQGTVTLL